MIDSNTPASQLHQSVMLERCIELMAPALSRPASLSVDATLGMGGHAEAVLDRFPRTRLIGIDRDQNAIRLAGQRLARFDSRVTLIHASNGELAEVIEQEAPSGVDAILFDLGVSSLQLDDPERGFSYRFDAALDMRMDDTDELTAFDVVNEYSVAELTTLLRTYGEEPFAHQIARRVAAEREQAPISTTLQLVDIIDRCIPKKESRQRGHNAKKTFQAIRVEVNQELATLRRALPAAVDALRPGGRIVVMSFQSLEDRIVKTAFAQLSTSRAPEGLPFDVPGYAPVIRLVTKGAEKSSPAEQASNPRAISVRLRAAEKVGTP